MSVCPNCGYCPTCRRPERAPYTHPYQPWPYVQPRATWTYAGGSTTVTGVSPHPYSPPKPWTYSDGSEMIAKFPPVALRTGDALKVTTAWTSD